MEPAYLHTLVYVLMDGLALIAIQVCTYTVVAKVAMYECVQPTHTYTHIHMYCIYVPIL